MKPETWKWVEKAEGDFFTASRELRARKAPNYDAVCLHVQQCAEKYLKARMIEADLEPPRIHNLAALLTQIVPIEPIWDSFREELAVLTVFAVDLRYPDNRADKPMARDAMRKLRPFRSAARTALGLPTD